MTPSADAEPTLASIPGQRRGRTRLELLSQRERGLYDWILTAFAAGTPPTPGTLADAASSLELRGRGGARHLRARRSRPPRCRDRRDPGRLPLLRNPARAPGADRRQLLRRGDVRDRRARDRADARLADRDHLPRPAHRPRGVGAARPGRGRLVGA